MTRLEEKLSQLSTTIETSSGTVLQVRYYPEHDAMRFEARGSVHPILNPRELDSRIHKPTLEGIKKKGLNPRGYVVMGTVPMPRSTADELLEIREKAISIGKEYMEEMFPGLEDLRSAQAAAEKYSEDFHHSMEGESNDGCRPPVGPTGPSVSELSAKYPRAALYLRAEEYGCSSNHHKNGAGKRAMQLLEEGESIEDALVILENWLPATAYEN